MPTLDQAFAALADPTRRGIVVHLACGEATVSELVQKFTLTQPTISSHLKVLESAGWIVRRRQAQSKICRLDLDRLKEISGWLDHLRQVWEGNYRRLDALLAELQSPPPEKGSS